MEKQKIKIDHYILDKTIGAGAFSKVKLAHHEITKTQVAVKIINKKKMQQAKMGKKIKREVRLMRYFNHPNIIKLYEVLDTPQDIFVVMEYIPGGELFEQVVKQGRIPENLAKIYIKQIIEGVEYCHQNLVSHRDLKLENILLNQNQQIKIADFGLSNLMKDGKFLKTSCGSPNYAAPEVVSGKKYSGIEVDTWSCGVIIFTLLAGYLPFDEELIPKLFKKIKEVDYRIPNNFSPLAKDLIIRIFQKEPNQRIKLTDIKFHPWLRDGKSLQLNLYKQLKINNLYQIDEEVLQKLVSLPLKFHELTTQQIREAIILNKTYTFVTIYQMLYNQYRQDNNLAEVPKKFGFQKINEIFEKCVDSSPSFFLGINQQNQQQSTKQIQKIKEIDQKKNWVFGIQINDLSCLSIMKICYECLDQFNIRIVLKNKFYRIKCFFNTNLDSQENQVYEDSQKINESNKNKDAKFKFSKNEIVFSIQLYQLPSKGHVIDFHLNRGHPIIFMDLCQHLIRMILKSVKFQKDMIKKKNMDN